jgi:flavin reductase (DIM6/NTAB) family NADH-FMN oxidoreductase RutF
MEGMMDEEAKKTVLRMIPYGLFVLTAKDSEGQFAAASMNWVTQASFSPTQIVVCVKKGSSTHKVVEGAGKFGLNVLGKSQSDLAFTFFKHVEEHDGKLGGAAYHFVDDVPVLSSVPAYMVCEVSAVMGDGDHSVVLSKVIDVGLQAKVEGRPDEATLWLRDLEGNLFYGG